MVNPRHFRERICSIISQSYEIEFLGHNFDKIVSLLSEIQAGMIYDWVSAIMTCPGKPLRPPSNKMYKRWRLKQILVFRKALTIKGNAYRVLLVKVKNGFYIEFHLGDHDYYDKIRTDLKIKKTSL
jgi:hypothetical protein